MAKIFLIGIVVLALGGIIGFRILDYQRSKEEKEETTIIRKKFRG